MNLESQTVERDNIVSHVESAPVEASQEPPEAVSTEADSAPVSEEEVAAKAKAEEEAKAKADARKARLDELKALTESEAAKVREKARKRAERERAASLQREAEEQARQYRALMAKAKEDPLAWAEENGINPEAIIDRAIKKGSQEEKIAALHAKLERFEQERVQEQQKIQQVARQQQFERGARALVEHVFGDEEKYPALTLSYHQRERQLALDAHSVYIQATESGYKYSDQEILDYLEQREVSRLLDDKASKRLERLLSLSKVKGAPEVERSEAQASEGKELATGREGQQTGKPRTLTNGTSAQRAKLSKSIDELPEHEQNKALGELLRKSWRG